MAESVQQLAVDADGQPDKRHLIIFDGVCNFCNSSVNFIIERDKNNAFAFTPIQSELAQALMAKYGVTHLGMDTFLLIKNDQCYLRTDAALEIAKDLSGYWYLFRAVKVIPRPLRDFFYGVFARYRYRLFGKKDVCMVPTDEVRGKFVGVGENKEKSLRDFIGAGRHLSRFSSVEDVDVFVASNRETWDVSSQQPTRPK